MKEERNRTLHQMKDKYRNSYLSYITNKLGMHFEVGSLRWFGYFAINVIGPFLLPANEVCEDYVFTPVCQSLCSQEGCLPQCMLCYTPPSRHPQSNHPPPQSRHPPHPHAVHAWRYGQQVGGMHSTGMHSCYIKYYRIYHKSLIWTLRSNSIFVKLSTITSICM